MRRRDPTPKIKFIPTPGARERIVQAMLASAPPEHLVVYRNRSFADEVRAIFPRGSLDFLAKHRAAEVLRMRVSFQCPHRQTVMDPNGRHWSEQILVIHVSRTPMGTLTLQEAMIANEASGTALAWVEACLDAAGVKDGGRIFEPVTAD